MREIKIFTVTYIIVMIVMYLIVALIGMQFNPWTWDNQVVFEFMFFGNTGAMVMGLFYSALCPKEIIK